jgi:EpsI family protein
MMSRTRRQALAIFAGMAAAAVLGALAIPTRSAHGPAGVDLEAAIPAQFGPWKIDPLAAAFVRPAGDGLSERLYQQLLERTYIDPLGRRVMLSIAHGRDQAAGLELHLPEICYRYAGFTVGGRHVAEIQIAGKITPVTRLAADLPLRPELVTYWIVLGGERIADGNTFRLRRLANAVRREPADGLLVRVSSLDIDAGRAFVLQAQFIDDMVRALSAADRARIVGTAAPT